MTDTATKTQTTTITGADVRKCAQFTVDDIALAHEAYGHALGMGKARLARDIGLIYLGEWAIEIVVEMFDAKTRVVHGRHIYRPKADLKTQHHEPGSFKRLKLPQGLSIRVIARRNPQKPTEEADEFFREIGWHSVEPLVESGRGVTERDGGFRSGGFTIERWVYFDSDTEDNGGVLR